MNRPEPVIEPEISLIESCLYLMHDYINDNPAEISEPDFEDTMHQEIIELFTLASVSEEEVDDIFDISLELFYIYFIPPRSFSHTFILIDNKSKYLFSLNDLISIIETAIGNSPEFFSPQILCHKT